MGISHRRPMNKKPLKPWSQVLTLPLVICPASLLVCMLSDWIGGSLAEAFPSEYRMVIEKTGLCGGLLLGVLFGVLLWTQIMSQRHSPDEVKRFSDRYLSGSELHLIVNAYLRRLLDRGSRD